MITRRLIEAMQADQIDGWSAERYKPDTHPQEAYTISYCNRPLCGVATVEGRDVFAFVSELDRETALSVVIRHLKQLEPK
jgi:hypothetical protein